MSETYTVYITQSDAARILGVSPAAINNAIANGSLPATDHRPPKVELAELYAWGLRTGRIGGDVEFGEFQEKAEKVVGFVNWPALIGMGILALIGYGAYEIFVKGEGGK